MKVRGLPVIFAGGVLFGVGLAVSKMVEQEVVLGFLQLRDMGLAVTMGAALLVAIPVYQLAPRLRPAPPLGPAWDRHPRRVTARHLLGGAIFGVGWGVSGICPGSAMASLGTGNWPILAGVAGMLLGALAQGVLLPERTAGAPARGRPGHPRQYHDPMARITRAALIQASCDASPGAPMPRIKQAMIDKHVALIAEARERGAAVCCLQELFYGPYFAAGQDEKWFQMTEPVPGGPTLAIMAEQARRHSMILVVPIYEVDAPGVFYNTAAIIDEHGRYLGKYRKMHLPHIEPGFWEKFYFSPGDLGYPVWETGAGRIGILLCYDRHFPEAARALGLAGAEIVFNPSATVAGLSEHLWKIEQPAHAVANQFFVGAINRVGTEAPWNIGEFYGTSYFCSPRGEIIAQGPRDRDAVVVADLDLDMIGEVRAAWPFFQDRRPESYPPVHAGAGR